MDEAYLILEDTYKDDYSQILPVYPHIASANAKAIAPEMDIVVEKVIRVALVHEVGEYVDDSYVMMGQAQFLKQDYETAEETFEFFREEFNPKNPYGRGYVSKKKSRKQKKKERAAEKKEREKKRAEEKKQREEEKKAREEQKKAEKKAREEARKQREKEKKAERKRRKKEKERARKKRKRGKRGSKKRPEKPAVQDTTADKPIVNPKPKAPVVAPKEKKQDLAEDDEEEEVKEKKKEPLDKTAYSEGLLWLAKTYIERDNYSSATNLLNQLDKKNVQKHVREELAPTRAHLYMRKGDIEKALPYLDEAIETTGDKSRKARYAYIIGQIYQQLGRRDEAARAFARVDQYRPSFDMLINAELSGLQFAMASGDKSADQAIGDLEKMLKQAKYEGYEDRIYYTIGSIYEEEGSVAAALQAYTQSNSKNTDNVSLKTEVYYAMAELTYVEEDYLNSKYYYDSTLQNMKTTDLRYKTVQTLAENLKDIASNIEIVLLQDSLLALSNLDEDALREFATERARAKAEEDSAEAAASMVEAAPKSGDRIFGTSDNWPYDIKKVERGKRKFEEKWGDRPLVDNWRRSEVVSATVAQIDEASGEEEEIVVSEKAVQEVLDGIPGNPTEIEEAELKLEKALYSLGVLYRDKLEKQEKSIATLEELLSRFPDTQHKLDAYYSIYLSYLELDDQAGASRYLALINEDFGETDLAQRLSNPDAAEKLTDEERILAFYEDTYRLFESGRFDEVSERVNTAASAFDNDFGLKPKFALLNAMSLGKLNGKEAYKAALTDMITRHSGTSEATRAQEILRFLKGDDEAFEQLDIKEVDDIFKQEDERRHYILMITKGVSNDEFVQAKIAVSNYNKKYHKLDKLQLNESFLDKDEGTRVLLIRPFDDKGRAMKYYKEVVNAIPEFVGRDDLDFELLAATQGNYRRIVQERKTNTYRVFFDKYYLDKKK